MPLLLFPEKKSWLLEVFSQLFLPCFSTEIYFVSVKLFLLLSVLGEVQILTEELEKNLPCHEFLTRYTLYNSWRIIASH